MLAIFEIFEFGCSLDFEIFVSGDPFGIKRVGKVGHIFRFLKSK